MGSYTPRLNLYKPDPEETAWASDINNNFDILDDIEFQLEDDASVFQEAGIAHAGVSNNAARADHVHPGGAITWDKISGKPSTFPATAHASSHAAGGSDVITPSSIGAEPTITTKNTAFNKNFETDVTVLKSPGSVNVGTANTIARADHVHPAQTSVSGNAATATKLQTVRSIALGTGCTGTATAFDGSKNITIPVTGINADYISSGTVNNNRLTVGSKSTKGILQVGDGISVNNGVISIQYAAYPSLARLFVSNTGYGTLIVSNVYNGSIGQLPSGLVLQNPDDEHTVNYVATAILSAGGGQRQYARGHVVVQAQNTSDGTIRTLFSTSTQSEYGYATHTWSGTTTIKMTEILTGYAVNDSPSTGGISFSSMASNDNTIYLGSPI